MHPQESSFQNTPVLPHPFPRCLLCMRGNDLAQGKLSFSSSDEILPLNPRDGTVLLGVYRMVLASRCHRDMTSEAPLGPLGSLWPCCDRLL